ncbi:MAG: response regulator transcription factor [Bacillota bacterium]
MSCIVISNLKNMADQSAGNPSLEQLTSQEKKVLTLIAEAKTNQEIADELFLSEKTVRNYVSNIFKKLDFANRSQAVVYARTLRKMD